MITMLLGGLWHGAGWSFVLWGGLHGLYLVANHLWRRFNGITDDAGRRSGLLNAVSVLLTFLLVVIAWVPFRAGSFHATISMWQAMAGLVADAGHEAQSLDLLLGGRGSEAVCWLVAGLAIVWLLPNSQQWLARYAPAWDRHIAPGWMHWVFNRITGVIAGLLFALALVGIGRVSAFLYFQF